MISAVSDIMTIEEQVQNSDIKEPSNGSRTFEYELSDKASKAKIIKGAKRIPFTMKENTSSTNLVFSAGSWQKAVIPAVKYWNEIKGDKTCKVGDTLIKVGGVKFGKDTSGNKCEYERREPGHRAYPGALVHILSVLCGLLLPCDP